MQLLACGRSLALNRAELVFLAMLTISDYMRGVPHVGATTAFLLIRRFLQPRLRALEHSAAFCGVCNFDAADTRALQQDEPVAPLADLVLDALCDFRDWFTSAHQLMRCGDRSEYHTLPSQLKSLLSQLELHDLCDIVRMYLQPLEFLQLQRQFCPKFAFHSFLSADAGADAPTAQQSSSASCASVAFDMGAYARSREALQRWSMPDTKALAQ